MIETIMAKANSKIPVIKDEGSRGRRKDAVFSGDCFLFCLSGFARRDLSLRPILHRNGMGYMTSAKDDERVSTTSVTSSRPNEIDRENPDIDHYAKLEKGVMRKIDFWLVGFYSVVYIFRVIDSNNYANAAILNLEAGTGIKKELAFSSSQWSWTQTIVSYSYLIFEPSNTILLKSFKPSTWMLVLILSWGICACAAGAAQNLLGMMCVRSAIGMAEAGFHPAVLYRMAFWYKPSELPWTIALFYSHGQVSGPLSGLFAYAISFANGAAGLSGWRWLFVVERPSGHCPVFCGPARSSRLPRDRPHVDGEGTSVPDWPSFFLGALWKREKLGLGRCQSAFHESYA